MLKKLSASLFAGAVLFGGVAPAATNPTVVNFVDGQVLKAAQLNAMQQGLVPRSIINQSDGVAGLTADTSLSDSPRRIHLFMSSSRYSDLDYFLSNADLLVNSGIVSLGAGYGFVGITAAQQAALDAYWKYSNLKLTSGGGGELITEINVGTITDANDPKLTRTGGKLGEEIEANLYNTGAGNSSYTDPKTGVVYGCYATAADLAQVKASVDNYITWGAKNYGVTSAPNCGTEDFSQPFATGEFWANVRAMALYGGALVIDAAPTIFFNHATPAGMPGDVATEYPDMIAQMIVWAKQQGLRTNITITPAAADTGLDTDMLAAMKSEVDFLRSKDAIPSEFLVDQYNADDSSTTNGPWGDFVPNSLNQVVLYLMTVKAADAGSTYPQASGGLPGDQLMTGNLRFIAQNQVPDKSGSMGTESVNDVRIHGGYIGDTYSNASGVHVTLMSAGGSSFSSQVPLLLQGGNGNPEITGLSTDGYLHVFNPFVNDNAEVGVTLGIDTGAPSIIRSGTTIDMSSATEIKATAAFLTDGLTMYSNYNTSSPVHPSIYAGTTDNYVHIGSAFTTDAEKIGLAFDDDDTGVSFGSFSGMPNGSGVQFKGTTFLVGSSLGVTGSGIYSESTGLTLTDIKAGTYATSTQVWCGNCLNTGQTTGEGSGTWIFRDTGGTWRVMGGTTEATE